MAGSVVDHVYLAGVEPRLQMIEWQVQLEDASLAVTSIHVGQFHQRALEHLRFPAEKRDVRKQMNPAFGLFSSCRLFCAGSTRVVHFVIKKQVLCGGEDVRHIWNDLLPVTNEGVRSCALLRSLQLSREDNRADLDGLRLQIWNLQVGLE